MLTDEQFGVAAADQGKKKKGVGAVAQLKGIAGKQHQRNVTTAADVAPFYKKYLNGATPPFVSLLDDKQRISTLFGTFKVPETFIIGKDGRVKEKIVGSYTWNDPLVAHYLELLAQ